MAEDSTITLDENYLLTVYMNEAGRYPILDKEETLDLLVKARNGDEDARSKLICHNLRFVVKIARTMQGRGLPLADLISEGNIGLCMAIEKYDFNHKSISGELPHFTTESYWWIRQSMQRGIDNKAKLIRVPVHEKAVMIDALCKMNGSEGGEMMDFEQACKAVGRTPEKMRKVYAAFRPTESLDRPLVVNGVSKKDDRTTVQDVIPDNGYTNNLIEERSLKDALRSEMDRLLNDREKQVIKMRFGIEESYQWTLMGIAEVFSVSKERIRQIEVKALKKLQKSKVLREWQFV